MSENPSTPPRGGPGPAPAAAAPDEAAGSGPGATPDPRADTSAEIALREKVREMTTGVLRSGRIDPKAMEEITRAVLGRPGAEAEADVDRDARAELVAALAELDAALMQSAEGAHAALQRLIAKGPGFGDNDLKEVFAQLKALQTSYARIADRVARATTGTLQQELREVATHAQRLGIDAGARAANLMTELGQRLGAGYRETTSEGFETARQYGVRMSMLASGVLAGVADALRDYAARPSRPEPPSPSEPGGPRQPPD